MIRWLDEYKHANIYLYLREYEYKAVRTRWGFNHWYVLDLKLKILCLTF